MGMHLLQLEPTGFWDTFRAYPTIDTLATGQTSAQHTEWSSAVGQHPAKSGNSNQTSQRPIATSFGKVPTNHYSGR
jgi:hypothetical protein